MIHRTPFITNSRVRRGGWRKERKIRFLPTLRSSTELKAWAASMLVSRKAVLKQN